MKILPPGLTFQQAVVRGYAGRIEFPAYLAWLRTLPCDTCGRPAPSEASHVNAVKGMGTKSPDPFSIPECHECNRNYDRHAPEADDRLQRAVWYLLRAIWEGHLVWSRMPVPPISLPPSLAGEWTPARVLHLAQAGQIDDLCKLLNRLQPVTA